MIHVIASIDIKSGTKSDFLRIFKANIPAVLAEKGCISYEPTIDTETGLPPQELNENKVTIIEKWESVADLHAHLKAPHMVQYSKDVKELVNGLSIKVLEKA